MIDSNNECWIFEGKKESKTYSFTFHITTSELGSRLGEFLTVIRPDFKSLAYSNLRLLMSIQNSKGHCGVSYSPTVIQYREFLESLVNKCISRNRINIKIW